jgi:predicted Abi (CAAX) family protease
MDFPLSMAPLSPSDVAEQSARPETQTTSNYARYISADFNRPDHYPLSATPNTSLYRPTGAWLGRLILPAQDERAHVMGSLLEVHLAPSEHRSLVGRVVRLRWADDPHTNARFWGQTRAVTFNPNSEKLAAEGSILPERVNRWDLVNPFESLAGAHPIDDITVRLSEPVRVIFSDLDGETILATPGEPVQVTGRYYGLVRFLAADPSNPELYQVAHFDRAHNDFSGPSETVRVPTVVQDVNGVRPSSNVRLPESPANEAGWYIYGALDPGGEFVVQALAPRALLRVDGHTPIVPPSEAGHYLSPKAWSRATRKGGVTRAGIAPESSPTWTEGDEALLIHVYGGIGGKKREPAARAPLYWGHFAFGVARVVREPLADELIFDITYHQIYAHNFDGLIAGALHWTRYCGDRQFGWLGTRPVQDILLKLDCFTSPFEADPYRRSGLTAVVHALESMAARYRIADGRGGIRVSPAYNCAQDANQALYQAIRWLVGALEYRVNEAELQRRYPDDARRRLKLLALVDDIRSALLPFGADRADWRWGAETLGSGMSRSLLKNLSLAVRTWRTMIPPVAARSLAGVFLKHGATAMVLRSYQVGGDDPDIEPYVPNV